MNFNDIFGDWLWVFIVLLLIAVILCSMAGWYKPWKVDQPKLWRGAAMVLFILTLLAAYSMYKDAKNESNKNNVTGTRMHVDSSRSML